MKCIGIAERRNLESGWNIRKSNLITIKEYRRQSKHDLLSKLSKPKQFILQPTMGEVIFFEIEFKNPWRKKRSFRIDILDPMGPTKDLQLVSNPSETSFHKQKLRLNTPTKRRLFRTDTIITLSANEKVNIPFKFQSFLTSEKDKSIPFLLSVKNEEEGSEDDGTPQSILPRTIVVDIGVLESHHHSTDATTKATSTMNTQRSSATGRWGTTRSNGSRSASGSSEDSIPESSHKSSRAHHVMKFEVNVKPKHFSIDRSFDIHQVANEKFTVSLPLPLGIVGDYTSNFGIGNDENVVTIRCTDDSIGFELDDKEQVKRDSPLFFLPTKQKRDLFLPLRIAHFSL